MLKEKPRRWTDLREALGLSEAGLSRYIGYLKDDDIIKKELNDEENIVYILNEDNFQDSEWKEKLENKEGVEEEIIEALEEEGLYGEGLSLSDFREFVENNKEQLENLPLKHDFDDLSDIELAELFLNLTRILEVGNTELEASFRIK